MKILKEIDTNEIAFTNYNFTTQSKDWNHDNDIYTMRTAEVVQASSRPFEMEEQQIRDGYKELNSITFYDKLSNNNVTLNANEIKEVNFNISYKQQNGTMNIEGRELKVIDNHTCNYELINEDGIVFRTNELNEVELEDTIEESLDIDTLNTLETEDNIELLYNNDYYYIKVEENDNTKVSKVCKNNISNCPSITDIRKYEPHKLEI